MTAEYTTSLLYSGNPYVEALPPMLAGQELIRALASVPLYSTSDRDRSTGERLQLLSALYEFYQPLTMTLDLYCEVYNAMQHCYGQSHRSERLPLSNRATPLCRARLLLHPSAAATPFPLLVCLGWASQRHCSGFCLYFLELFTTNATKGKCYVVSKFPIWSYRLRTTARLKP